MVNWLIVFSLLLCSCTAMAEMVDLSPNETGDRIALVQGGQVRYLSANRVELVDSISGGGACRYIRRSSNGDLYVTGIGLEGGGAERMCFQIWTRVITRCNTLDDLIT